VVEAEAPAMEETVPGTDSIEALDFETPVLEAPFLETAVLEEAPTVEAPVEVALAEAPVAEAPVIEAPAPPAMDDLKARIEETRRRIRQELEQPFMSGGAAPDIADDWTFAPAVPAAELVAMQTESAGLESAGPEIAELSEASLPIGDYEGAETVTEEPVDYDSMKSRIESVRSRLKAKAFDAMMSGESALLGRDTEDAGHRRNVLPDVEPEVDETIETSLREEED